MVDDRLKIIENKLNKAYSNDNTDRLINPISGERSSGNIDSVYPNVEESTYIDNQRRFPDVTEVSSYERYGVPVSRHSNYNRQRAEAQTWKEQALNMAKQMGTVIGGEAISGFGSIGALAEAIATEIGGGDADFNNLMMEWGEQLQEYGREKAPIYRTDPNKAWDISDSGWWFNNATSVASSFGLLIPGMAVSSGLGKGLGLLGKMARISSIAGKGGKAATMTGKMLASGAKFGQAASYYGKIGSTAVTMRNAENFKESMQVRNQMFDKILNASDGEIQNIKSNPKLASEFESQKGFSIANATRGDVADFVAAKAGWTTYRNDAVNVVFDMVQLAPLFRGLKPNTRTRLNNSKIVNTNRKYSGLDPLTKSASFANNAAYYGLGTFGFETITEGIEEAVNYMASESGLDYGKNLMGKLSDEDYNNKFSRYLKDPMLWEQAFWGAVGGGLFAGGSRAIRDIRNSVLDRTDSASTKSRVGEIASRSIMSGMIAKDIKLINQGLNPFVKNPDGTNAPIEAGREEFLMDMVRQTRWWDIGTNAAKHHNTNLLLTQLDTPEYKQQLIADSKNDPNGELTEEEATQLIEEAKTHVVNAEKSYIKNQTAIFKRAIEEHMKPLLVHTGMQLDKEIAQNNKIIEEVTKNINEELASETNSIIRESFNKEYEKDGFTYDETLRKLALQETLNYLKGLRKTSKNSASGRYIQTMVAEAVKNNQVPDLDAISREALKIEDPVMADRIIKAENAINEELAALTNVKIPKDFTKKYANDILVDNMSIKTTHEVLNKILRGEVEDLLTNTESVADRYTKEFKQIKKDSSLLQFKRVHRDIDSKAKKLAKATTPEDIEKAREELRAIRRKLRRDKSLDTPNKSIAKEYEGAINRITEILKYNKKLRADAVKANTPYVIPEEYNPPGIITDIIDTFGTEQITPSVEQTEDIEENVGIQATDNSFSMFISSVKNIGKFPNADNVLSLNEEETSVWDLITNKIVKGTTLTIKPLPTQSKIITPTGKERERTINEREIGVYTEDGVLIGMLNDISTVNGRPAFNHKGLVYTAETSWVSKFVIALQSGKLDNEMLLFRDLGHAYLTKNNEQWSKTYAQLEKSGLLNEILNTNRQANKLKGLTKDSDGNFTNELKVAIMHASAIINNKIKQEDLLLQYATEDIIASINKWNSRLQNDIIHTTSLRNKLDDNNVDNIKVTVSNKTPGSIITNDKNNKPNFTRINNISSDNTENLNTPIFFVTPGNLTKLESANNAGQGYSYDINPNNEDKGINGIPYIQLQMASIDGTPVHKYFRAQIGKFGLENTPKDTVAYNIQLVKALADRIVNSSEYGNKKAAEAKIKDLYEILKYYFIVSHVTKDGKNIGVAIKTSKPLIDKKTGKPKMTEGDIKKGIKPRVINHEFRILVNEEGKLGIYSEQGSKNLAENADELYERFKEQGVLRNVYTTINKSGIRRLSEKPFTDFVTGTPYTNYTKFLVDTGAILSSYGSVRDANGNKISNVDTSDRFNRKGQPLILMLKPTDVNFKNPSKKRDTFQKPTVKYTSLAAFGKAIDPTNEYDFLFDLVDKLGVNFDSDNIVDSNEYFAEFDNATNTLSISSKFYKTDDINKIKFLAHDTIHRVIKNGLTDTHREELKDVLKDVKSNLSATFKKLQYNKESKVLVNSIIEKAEKDIEELITYSMTNVTFAKVLSQVESDTKLDVTKEGIVDKLLRIIKEAVQLVFGTSALDRVANVLEDVVRANNEIYAKTETTETTETQSKKDKMDEAMRRKRGGKKAVIADINLNIGSAKSFIKDMTKEERAVTRELINNRNVIFKC